MQERSLSPRKNCGKVLFLAVSAIPQKEIIGTQLVNGRAVLSLGE
jgi:hypothetical protein